MCTISFMASRPFCQAQRVGLRWSMSSFTRYSVTADSSSRKNGSDDTVCKITSKSAMKIPATYIVCGHGNLCLLITIWYLKLFVRISSSNIKVYGLQWETWEAINDELNLQFWNVYPQCMLSQQWQNASSTGRFYYWNPFYNLVPNILELTTGLYVPTSN